MPADIHVQTHAEGQRRDSHTAGEAIAHDPLVASYVWWADEEGRTRRFTNQPALFRSGLLLRPPVILSKQRPRQLEKSAVMRRAACC